MNRIKNRNGFTLAELLISVAIIAVLVAIAIPILTGHFEKTWEATDMANIRSAYVELGAKANVGEDLGKAKIKLKQRKDGWKITPDFPNNAEVIGTPKAGGYATVYYKENEVEACIEFTADRATP